MPSTSERSSTCPGSAWSSSTPQQRARLESGGNHPVRPFRRDPRPPGARRSRAWDSQLTASSVDHATSATRFPDVYALGDLSALPMAKAGVFAARPRRGRGRRHRCTSARRGASAALPGRRQLLHRIRGGMVGGRRGQLPRRAGSDSTLVRTVSGTCLGQGNVASTHAHAGSEPGSQPRSASSTASSKASARPSALTASYSSPSDARAGAR